MSQPIDEAYVEVRPDVDRFATTLGQKLTAALNKAQASVDQSMRQVSERLGAAGAAGGQQFGDGFSRDASGRLRDARGRFVREGAQLGGAVAGGLGASLSGLGSSLVSALGSSLSLVSGSVASLVPAAIGATAALAALGGTMSALGATAAALIGGALGALPAVIAGVGGIVATLGLGLFGLSDQFKQTSKAAGGAGAAVADNSRAIAAAQRQVENAERRLSEAQRERLRVQNAVNDAVEEARERIEDLGRSLRRSRIDQQRATEDLARAQEDLNFALETGDPDTIRRARQAYEEAQLAVEETADRTEDLTKEKTESDRKGVQGSDEVVEALEKQRQATEAVKDAQRDLADAQAALRDAQKPPAGGGGGGGGGVGQELTKIAPAALRFVNAIKSLKPAFDDLRLDVQQRLFAGLDRTIKSLAAVWFPQLKVSLGGFADTFNGLAKTLGRSLIDPDFVRNIAAGMESIRALVERVGGALAGPFVDAFGRLAAAAEPFLAVVGDEIAKLVEDFSAFIGTADESGKLTAFFERAGQAMRDVVEVGRAFGSIVGSVIKILFGAQPAGGSGFTETLQRLAGFLEDPKNQATLRQYVGSIATLGKIILTDVLPPISRLLFFLGTLQNRTEGAITRLSTAWSSIMATFSGFASSIATTAQELPGRVVSFITGLPAQVGQILTSLVNRGGQIIGFGVGRMVRFFVELPGRATAAIRELPGQVASVASAAVNRGVSILSGLPGRAANAVSAASGKIKSALSGLPGQMVNIGKDVVRGLWDGITSMGGWLKDRVKGFANSVIDGFKKGFSTGSPSRRMRDEVGRFLPPGLAIGIERNLGVVETARDKLIAAAIPTSPAVLEATAAVGQLQALTAAPTSPAAATAGGTVGLDLAALSGLLSQIKAGHAELPAINVQVFLGTREITDIVDTRITRWGRGQARKLDARPREP